MRETPATPDEHGPGTGPVGPDRRLDVLAAEYQLLLREMLDAAIDQLSWGDAESVTGLTLREHLTLTGGLPGPVASRLEAVAHRMRAVPQVAAAYRAGLLSFDQFADFVRLTQSCHGPRLATLDEQAGLLAAELASQGRGQDFGWETEVLYEDTRAPGHAERAERRARDGQRLVRQQDLDGGGFIYAELGPVGFTTANAAIDAGADALQGDADQRGVPRETSLQRLRADGLVLLAEVFLAGCHGHPDTHDQSSRDPDDSSGERAAAGAVAGADGGADGGAGATGRVAGGCRMRRAARPTIQVLVDVADATADRFGALLRTVGGGRVPMLSARLLDTLAGNAELLVQLRDGRRPLAELRATGTPEPVRRAVLARDGGCRFGLCNAPPSALHVHHIDGRDPDGSHDPDAMFTACTQHHLRHIHAYGWRPELLPLTGEIIWRHPSGRRFSTMPRIRRPRPRTSDEIAAWRAPPRPPPPHHDEPPPRPDRPCHWTDPPAGLDQVLARAP